MFRIQFYFAAYTASKLSMLFFIGAQKDPITVLLGTFTDLYRCDPSCGFTASKYLIIRITPSQGTVHGHGSEVTKAELSLKHATAEAIALERAIETHIQAASETSAARRLRSTERRTV